mmetsp:Transcript_19697/g.48149  ORF Transcript_19697/g.48149 Transcript_19697/m.48149 type:complete len:200 (+) Transcript_19697:278-877(+)
MKRCPSARVSCSSGFDPASIPSNSSTNSQPAPSSASRTSQNPARGPAPPAEARALALNASQASLPLSRGKSCPSVLDTPEGEEEEEAALPSSAQRRSSTPKHARRISVRATPRRRMSSLRATTPARTLSRSSPRLPAAAASLAAVRNGLACVSFSTPSRAAYPKFARPEAIARISLSFVMSPRVTATAEQSIPPCASPA